MLTEADFAPIPTPRPATRDRGTGGDPARRDRPRRGAAASGRRSRRGRRVGALVTVAATGVGLGVWGMAGPATTALPTLADPDSFAVTTLSPRVVVFSRPMPATSELGAGRTTIHTETHSDTVTDSVTDPAVVPDKHGDGQDSGKDTDSGKRDSGSGSGSASSSGTSVFSPRVTDGPSGSATITNRDNSGTTTLHNGHTESSSASHSSTPSSASSSAPASASTSAGGTQALAAPVWPPLQTTNGTPAPTTAEAPSATPAASAPAVTNGSPGTAGTAGRAGSPALAAPVSQPAVAAAPVVHTAQMLMLVRCPAGEPAGSLCFEAIDTEGQAATLPSAANVSNLPLATSGGATGTPPATTSCPTTSPSTAAPSGGNSASGSSEASGKDSGGSGGGDSDSGGHSTGGHSTKKHSKKGHASADVLPGATSAATVASCGLLGQGASATPASPGTTGSAGSAVQGTPGALGAALDSAGSAAGGAATSATGGVNGAAGNVSALMGNAKTVSLTGYSFQDNTPPSSSTVSCPQIKSHNGKAGGTGTYDDPLTVASDGSHGGVGPSGVKCGDRFYVVNLRRYVVVEDTGNTPSKNGIHLDTWVADDPSKKCMNAITGDSKAIPNPPPGLPVEAGPIGTGSGCNLPNGDGKPEGSSEGTPQ